MGFFSARKRVSNPQGKISDETLNRAGCALCPLDKCAARMRSPKMGSVGAERPEVYVLGETPGLYGDSAREPITGAEKRFLRRNLRAHWKSSRLGALVRCGGISDRAPLRTEIECCRGYIEQDIAAAKPKVILGLGKPPLDWVTGKALRTTAWRGRMFPVKVGGHVCWYFCTLALEFALRNEDDRDTVERDIKKLNRFLRHEYSPPVYVEKRNAEKDVIRLDSFGLTGLAKLRRVLEDLAKEQRTAVDVETYPLRPYPRNNVPVMTSVSITGSEYTFAFPYQHPKGFDKKYWNRVYALLGQFILDSGYKITHNVEFETEWFAYYFGIDVVKRALWDDTMAQGYVLDDRQGALSLDVLTYLNFGFFLKSIAGVDTSDTRKVPVPDLLRYNALDSKWTYELFYRQAEYMDDPLWTEYKNRMRSSGSLVASMIEGVDVDLSIVDDLHEQFTNKIAIAKAKLRRLKSIKVFEKKKRTRFSPESSDHCVYLFRDILDMGDAIKTDKNKSGVSTDEKQLEAIAGKRPEVDLILKVRSLGTVRSTFLTDVDQTVFDDGKFHTTFNNKRTGTGRLSSDDPNLQNYPKRVYTEVRRQVVAPKGYKFVPIDYGQIEARVVAMASKDEFLVNALWTGYDIHEYWTTRLVELEYKFFKRIAKKLSLNPTTDEQKVFKGCRNEIKNGWVFPQFFGASTKSCANNMRVKDITTRKMGDEFWDTFRGVKDWQESLHEGYRETGYVTNLSGTRRRRYPLSWNQIINTPIQGTAFDLFSAANDDLSDMAITTGLPWLQSRLLVHDDLSFFIPYDNDFESRIDYIGDVMVQRRFDFVNVPIIAEISVGDNWADTKEIKVIESKYTREEIENV